MKKYLLFFAAAAIGLASCSNDETVEVIKSDAISFRPLMNGMTRATVKSAFASNDEINVYCTKGDVSPTSYFNNATFTYAAAGYSGFSSNPAYYWPSTIDGTTNLLTFYATFNGAQTTAGNISTFTPNAAAESQVDLLCAKLAVSSKPDAGEITTLNFKHALTQVEVKALNSNNTLKINISGVKLGYVAKAGTLNFTSGSPAWTFTNPENASDTYSYSQTWSAATLTSTAVVQGATWMIVPQNLTTGQSLPNKVYTKQYASATQTAANGTANLDCAYIALQLQFLNLANNAEIVATQWCYWPININLEAGKKYTFVIDAAGGGYQPGNIQNDASTALDEVLAGLAIKFSTATSITAWVTDLDENPGTNDEIEVAM